MNKALGVRLALMLFVYISLSGGSASSVQNLFHHRGDLQLLPEGEIVVLENKWREILSGRFPVASYQPTRPTNSSDFLAMGFCIERRFIANNKAITALSLAPDGRLFVALEASSIVDMDPDVFVDPYLPVRSVFVYDTLGLNEEYEVLSGSSRITDLFYHEGALYVSRAGEIGWLPDDGQYEPLATGFEVEGRLSHANNGITILDGQIFVASGGVVDGFSDGPIPIESVTGVQEAISRGNRWSAAILRADLVELIERRNIDVFEVVAIGVRNPYGLTHDLNGNLWFTDNGASAVMTEYLAGDEVNYIDSSSLMSKDEGDPMHFGFPLTLYGYLPESYVSPFVALNNSSAPTDITWAHDTAYFGAYGRNPGLYRIAYDSARGLVSELIMDAWPVIALEAGMNRTLWVGMGTGELLKLRPGCQ